MIAEHSLPLLKDPVKLINFWDALKVIISLPMRLFPCRQERNKMGHSRGMAKRYSNPKMNLIAILYIHFCIMSRAEENTPFLRDLGLIAFKIELL
jgi:hypothetical protein